MPVRKIPKNYRNVTGVASRHKAAGRAMPESTLECDKKRTYTLDVLVYFHGPSHCLRQSNVDHFRV